MTSTIPTDPIQEVRDRAAAANDLARWEANDSQYDARQAGEFDRHLDRVFGLDGAR